jgi:hypothetical protein
MMTYVTASNSCHNFQDFTLNKDSAFVGALNPQNYYLLYKVKSNNEMEIVTCDLLNASWS